MTDWKQQVQTRMQEFTPVGRPTHSGEQRYKSSPFRAGSDSNGFMVNYTEDVYNDFAGAGGTLRQLAEHFGIVVPREPLRMPVADTLREYGSLAEYAAAHGAPVEAFEKAGWEYATVGERPALAFAVQGGTKYRYLDGKKPKFTGKDIHKPWYGLKGAPGLAHRQKMENAPLVICNGEPSVVVAQWYHIPAVCVVGGESRIPEERLTEFNERWSGPVLIAMDCDDTGRQAQTAIAAQFDPKRVKVVDLGLGDKGDLADFCRLHGADSWVELITRSNHVIATKPDIEHELRETVGVLAKLATRQDREDGTEEQTLIRRARSYIDKLEAAQPKPPTSFTALAIELRETFTAAVASPNTVGLKSGLKKVDELIGGSWLPGLNYVCLGATGMGKTTLMVSLAAGLLKHAPGLICCTEIDKTLWFMKLVAYFSGVPASAIMRGAVTPEEAQRVHRAITQLSAYGCYMVPESNPTKDDIEYALDSHPAQWVIIDSLNKLSVPGALGIYEQTCGASDATQKIAKDRKLVVISTSQVGRDISNRAVKIPTINDGYGGGAIEHDARGLFTIYNHDYYVNIGAADEDPAMPAGIGMVKMLKNNFEYVSGQAALIENRGGIGFFNTPIRTVKLGVGD